ncbi:MAG: glycoside hydrolase family 9 protein [Spirochaetales bacterium]|nr:glycoside hydrolase family 9 protein [Spirochaetales bacterium]
MYLNYQDIDAVYADKCLSYAKALYTFGREHEGLGTGDGFYNSRDFEDDLSWAAVWLYVCTGDEEYIRHIDSYDSNGLYTGYMKKIISTTSNTWQNIWVHCWDATWGGTFTKLACLFPDRDDFDYFGRWNLEFWTGGAVQHEDSSDRNYLDPTPAGYAMINTWGSARYNTAAQLCCLVYYKYHPGAEGLAEWARGQMEYILGDNPMGYSYEVGYPSPEESAKHPHHRAAHGSKTNNMNDPPEHEHVLWGALVGGPDGDDNHVDDTTDFVYNEVGVDYNAAFAGALAGHYLLWDQGSQPLADFPPAEPVKDEFFAEAKLEQDTKQRTQITIRIHNETTCPPRYEDGISCRYFFNISELYNHGQDISDVSHQIMYDELSVAGGGLMTRRTGPVEYDQDAGIYYMEYAWEYDEFYADLELHFALVAAQDANYQENWDSSNDFSREGVTESYAINTHIPVYLDGVLVYGSEPGGEPTETPTPTPVQGTPTPTPVEGYVPGDVNEDNAIDIIDALLVAQYYVGIISQLPSA